MYTTKELLFALSPFTLSDMDLLALDELQSEQVLDVYRKDACVYDRGGYYSLLSISWSFYQNLSIDTIQAAIWARDKGGLNEEQVDELERVIAQTLRAHLLSWSTVETTTTLALAMYDKQRPTYHCLIEAVEALLADSTFTNDRHRCLFDLTDPYDFPRRKPREIARVARKVLLVDGRWHDESQLKKLRGMRFFCTTVSDIQEQKAIINTDKGWIRYL